MSAFRSSDSGILSRAWDAAALLIGGASCSLGIQSRRSRPASLEKTWLGMAHRHDTSIPWHMTCTPTDEAVPAHGIYRTLCVEEREAAGAINAVWLQDETQRPLDIALLLELALDHGPHLGNTLGCVKHRSGGKPERDIRHGWLTQLVRSAREV
jgi:hypothetical protein